MTRTTTYANQPNLAAIIKISKKFNPTSHLPIFHPDFQETSQADIIQKIIENKGNFSNKFQLGHEALGEFIIRNDTVNNLRFEDTEEKRIEAGLKLFERIFPIDHFGPWQNMVNIKSQQLNFGEEKYHNLTASELSMVRTAKFIANRTAKDLPMIDTENLPTIENFKWAAPYIDNHFTDLMIGPKGEAYGVETYTELPDGSLQPSTENVTAVIGSFLPCDTKVDVKLLPGKIVIPEKNPDTLSWVLDPLFVITEKLMQDEVYKEHSIEYTNIFALLMNSTTIPLEISSPLAAFGNWSDLWEPYTNNLENQRTLMDAIRTDNKDLLETSAKHVVLTYDSLKRLKELTVLLQADVERVHGRESDHAKLQNMLGISNFNYTLFEARKRVLIPTLEVAINCPTTPYMGLIPGYSYMNTTFPTLPNNLDDLPFTKIVPSRSTITVSEPYSPLDAVDELLRFGILGRFDHYYQRIDNIAHITQEHQIQNLEETGGGVLQRLETDQPMSEIFWDIMTHYGAHLFKDPMIVAEGSTQNAINAVDMLYNIGRQAMKGETKLKGLNGHKEIEISKKLGFMSQFIPGGFQAYAFIDEHGFDIDPREQIEDEILYGGIVGVPYQIGQSRRYVNLPVLLSDKHPVENRKLHYIFSYVANNPNQDNMIAMREELKEYISNILESPLTKEMPIVMKLQSVLTPLYAGIILENVHTELHPPVIEQVEVKDWFG